MGSKEVCASVVGNLRNQNKEKLKIESIRTLTNKIWDPIQNRAWNCSDFFPKINKLTRFMPQSQLKIQIKNMKKKDR